MIATKFRDSSEYSQCVQNVLAKSYLPCQILFLQTKKFLLLSAEKPRYEFSARVLRQSGAQSSPAPRSAVGRGAGELWARDWCYAGFVRSGFPSKIAQDKRDDKRRQRQTVHSFRSFIYPLSLLSNWSKQRLCAPCDVTKTTREFGQNKFIEPR